MARVQQHLIKLEKLLTIEPFKIIGLWSNGETRLNDFSTEVNFWKTSSNKELKKLSSPKVFTSAFIKDGTLAFAGSTVQVPGIPEKQPVDFDRRTLYNDSQLIGKAVTNVTRASTNRPKRRLSLPTNFHTTLKLRVFGNDSDAIRKMYQKLGASVTPLVQIGDELIELE